MSFRVLPFAIDDRWLPKSVLCLRDYNLNKFIRDVIAGITVGLVALPLAMAFAIASGLTPQSGIYCAVITGFLISALGGINDPDRRPDERLRRGRLGNRSGPRHRRAVHVHDDGRHTTGCAGCNRHGFGGEIY